MNYQHRNLKRFHMDGIIGDDASIPRLKDEYIRLLNMGMKQDGYAPRLDIPADFTLHYDKGNFAFELSVFGTFVGRKVALCLDGIDHGRPIYTQKSKSEEFSLKQE
jgi:hypothetical protein